jgi:hypothetical protein
MASPRAIFRCLCRRPCGLCRSNSTSETMANSRDSARYCPTTRYQLDALASGFDLLKRTCYKAYFGNIIQARMCLQQHPPRHMRVSRISSGLISMCSEHNRKLHFTDSRPHCGLFRSSCAFASSSFVGGGLIAPSVCIMFTITTGAIGTCNTQQHDV